MLERYSPYKTVGLYLQPIVKYDFFQKPTGFDNTQKTSNLININQELHEYFLTTEKIPRFIFYAVKVVCNKSTLAKILDG